MSSKKRDLEIVYSLRWKNKSKREESKEMSAVVVVYDIPSTTLNFEVFKNYLLKNSGTPEDDVRVYFIMENGKEYPIQSQTDFQVALYAFRRKARAGEMINLLLERVSDQPTHKNLRHSNDVETQFDNVEPSSILPVCCNADTPPEWFISGLAQLKKEIRDEIRSNVSTMIANVIADIKPPCVNAPAQHTACPYRVRTKPHKWPRKLTPHIVETVTDTKVLLKSMKLENKLEKLERKASKYREKRLALQHGQKSSDNAPKSSDSEAGPSGSKCRSKDKEVKRTLEEQQKLEDPKMDARPMNIQTSVPHMLGGEIYLHQWDVQNTGEIQWTSMTQLQYTWGSKKLVPMEKAIVVPHLKPGETGTISVRLQVPTQPGTYECYWQFTHKGRRFGQWLGVQIIVDSFDLKGHPSVLENSGPQACHFIHPKHLEEHQEKMRQTIEESKQEAKLNSLTSKYKPLQCQEPIDQYNVFMEMEKLRLEGETKGEYLSRLLKDEEIDSDCSWNSEPTHFWPKPIENGEFVMVPPVPQCFLLDTPDSSDNNKVKTATKKETNPEPTASTSGLKGLKLDGPEDFDDNNNTDCISRSSKNSIKFRDEELDNIVIISRPKDDQVKEGFIYVHVDGQKVLIPKNILKSEIISAVQDFDRHSSGNNSTGAVIDATETANESPSPSNASTVINQDTEQNKEKNMLLEQPCNIPEAVAALEADFRANLENVVEEAMERSNYFEANNFMSHCSAAGSCYSEVNANAERLNRMFVFPQDVPGYEVVYPALDIGSDLPSLTTDSCGEQTVNFPEPISHPLEAVPNYQQTPVELRHVPEERAAEPQIMGGEPEPTHSETTFSHPLEQPIPEQAAQDSSHSGRQNIPTPSAPQTPGEWVNGHWISSSPDTPREANLQALAEMGFWNRDLNATLLARFSDDLNRVVAELVQ